MAVQNGLPNLRSPKKAPRPSQPNLSPPPDTTRALTEQFHAPTSGRATPWHRLSFLYREVSPDALQIPPLEVEIRA